jgi:hypothetical protein
MRRIQERDLGLTRFTVPDEPGKRIRLRPARGIAHHGTAMDRSVVIARVARANPIELITR